MLLHYVTRLSRSVSGLLSHPSAQYKVHVFLVYWGISSSLRSHSVASGNCFPAWFTRCNKSGKAICNRLHLMVVGAASFRHRSVKKKKEEMKDICQQQCSHHRSMSVWKRQDSRKCFCWRPSNKMQLGKNTLNEHKVEKFILREHKSRALTSAATSFCRAPETKSYWRRDA